MNAKMKTDVLSVIKEIADRLKWNKYVNEHYLHHYFTYKLQQKGYEINLTKERRDFVVHPEWPTYRKEDNDNDIRIPYRRYAENKPDNSKTAKCGHFDFALGKYNEPEIGIEFIWEYGWNREEFIFDFVKCMDGALPFTTAISYAVVTRNKHLSTKNRKANFERKLNEAYNEARARLEHLHAIYQQSKRDVYLVITEIGQNGKRHWYFDKSQGRFREEASINNI